MEKFYIRYHVVGNRVVTDVREFKSFGEAVSRIAKVIKNEVIAVVKNNEHVIEIQTKHITYHEVMSEEVAEKEQALNRLGNLIESSFKKN
ncbi:hypothetical protein BTR22_18490 [Alkalihalophilus pseudofirmus]|uniref:hypothetical protein n=1 Tax=Alkalihalophilus pseudofirmus TaxID=79885 RepID=UPI000950E688|nr:hypothetical protein BTR22_18490 [Alkalihalophilus pseudofirmus]